MHHVLGPRDLGCRIVESIYKSQAKVYRNTNSFRWPTVPQSLADNNGGATENTEDPTEGIRRAPWVMTFDLRERETIWTEENKARLVRIVASHQLDMELSEVEERLEALNTLLPGISTFEFFVHSACTSCVSTSLKCIKIYTGEKVASIKPSLLAGLLQQGSGLVTRLINLKNLFPDANISELAVREPQILLQELNEIEANIERLKELLDIKNVDGLVEACPRMLQAEIVEEVLIELERLMPGKDAKAILLADPSWLLRVERGTKRMGDHPDAP